MAQNAAWSVGIQACRTLFKWGFLMLTHSHTQDEDQAILEKTAIPSASIYGLNPGRSWNPAELVEVSCTYLGSLRSWLCLKNTAERSQPETCIH